MKGFEFFKLDEQAIDKGVWCELPTLDDEKDPIEMRIIQWEGRLYTSKMDKVAKLLKIKFGRKILRTQNTISILKEICIRLLVNDWKNVYDEDGNEVPFSQDALRSVIEDKQSGDELTKWILERSKDLDLFRVEEDDIKN